VTSSVTSPFGSPPSLSYRLPIVTFLLAPLVFEIFDLKFADRQNSTLTDNKGPLKLSAREPIYDELDTKEGQVKIYKIAKARQRSRQDKMAVNIIKDRDGTILTDEKLIQERRKSYFEELLNVENPRDQL